MNLDSKIEALLFYKGEPEDIASLSKFFEVSEDEVRTALAELCARLEGRGLALVQHDTHIVLTTSADASGLIEKIRKEELVKDLGKAGIETLAIVIYKGPVSRADVDYIRGVNSSYILRNLLIRGLIEREHKKEEGKEGKGRSPHYIPSIELLAHLGITEIQHMPEYAQVRSELDAWAERDISKSENSEE